MSFFLFIGMPLMARLFMVIIISHSSVMIIGKMMTRMMLRVVLLMMSRIMIVHFFLRMVRCFSCHSMVMLSGHLLAAPCHKLFVVIIHVLHLLVIVVSFITLVKTVILSETNLFVMSFFFVMFCWCFMRSVKPAMLSNVMIDILITIIVWIHDAPVSLFYFPRFTFMLQDSFSLLSQCLFFLFLHLPFLLLGMCGEEWLNFVAMMVQFELVLTHVGVSRPELSVFGISVPLLLIYITLLLWQSLLILPASIIGLRSLIKLFTFTIVIVSFFSIIVMVLLSTVMSSGLG